MQTYKLLFAGPVGSGKTTAIKTLSDIPVVATEALASDEVRHLKSTTTVALDYGKMVLDSGDVVRLYGTPGQRRFEFMWEILSRDALGLVVLVDAGSPAPLEDLEAYILEFTPHFDRNAIIVGITHANDGHWDLRQRVNATLERHRMPPNAMIVDARDRVQMGLLIRTLVYSLETLGNTL